MRGREVDFTTDYYKPFAVRFANRIRRADPDALIFLESEPGQLPPRWSADDPSGIVWAPHWYDGLTLVRKRYSPWLGLDFGDTRLVFGKDRVRRSFTHQLGAQRRGAAERLGGVPTLIGETGIPFDLDEKLAYRTGDFRNQARALDRSLQAVEANQLSATLWDYTSDNTNARGDQWNDEDFSVFSRDQQVNPEDPELRGPGLERTGPSVPRGRGRGSDGDENSMCGRASFSSPSSMTRTSPRLRSSSPRGGSIHRAAV